MNDDVVDAVPPVPETSKEAAAICLLEGCSTPIPTNRKGGKKYCSKAHADQASRQRRQLAETTAGPLLDELRVLRREAELTFGEHAAPLLEAVTALRERFATLDSDAVAETARAREEAAAARLAQQEAQETAERERLRAQAAEHRAAADRQARADADRDAGRANDAARAAELARATAEGARQSAVEAKGAAEERAALAAGELAELRAEHSQAMTRLQLLDEHLTIERRRHEDTVRELREHQQAELRTQREHHQDLQRRAEADIAALREELIEERAASTRLREELDHLRAETSAAREETARTHARELATLHDRIAALNGDLGVAGEQAATAKSILTNWRASLAEILDQPPETVPDRLRTWLGGQS